jgi:hyperosmotically inducible periplasmic protein
MIFRLLRAVAALVIAAGCTPTPQPSATQLIKDGLLATKVRAQIVSVDVEAAARLGINVHDGAVRLTGVVRTEGERSRIDAAVRKIEGVKSLSDEVRIDPKLPAFSGGDFALAAHATAALAAQTGVNAANLRVSARNGVVTVTGHVPTPAIKETALETVRKIDGVKRVLDKIRVGT